MTQKILACAGRKESGKNTAANFIVGLELVSLGLVDEFRLNDLGRLLVPMGTPDNTFEGVMDMNSQNPVCVEWLSLNLWPYVKLYSFADLLKRNVCMDILGLTHQQCYGTNEEKNELTRYLWEKMPGAQPNYGEPDFIGPMTAREIMQAVGTGWFRELGGAVWAEATLRQIIAEGSELAIITDMRFPDENEEVKKHGGHSIRLTRDPHHDTHQSETALDPKNYDWANFDRVLDNKDMDLTQMTDTLREMITEMDLIGGVNV